VDAGLRARAEEFWAERLQCSPRLFREPGLHLLPHPQQAIFALVAGESSLVLAPESLHDALARLPAGESLLAPGVLAALAPAGALSIGPAFVGYLAELRVESFALERIAPGAPELASLRAEVSPSEWQHANLDAAEAPIFVERSEGRIAAAAGCQRLLERVAHIGVVTRAGVRGRGLGRRVAAASAAAALAAGLLPQYQTLFSNRPALAVGRRLGAQHFASTLALRRHGN
jgi:hypothetical protein